MNIYDVLSKVHTKATGEVQESVEEDLKVDDPPVEEAKAILAEKTDESTKGKDGKRSSKRNK